MRQMGQDEGDEHVVAVVGLRVDIGVAQRGPGFGAHGFALLVRGQRLRARRGFRGGIVAVAGVEPGADGLFLFRASGGEFLLRQREIFRRRAPPPPARRID